MANTLKFGNGNWATKEGSALAYNDENGNFKPLPFDFSRASSATVINKDGLIEEVGSNIPRIDFLGNTQGAFLLEPSRSNFYTQSNLFSFGGNVTSNNSLSPDGTLNASKITKTSSSDQFVILPWSASLSTSTTYSLSFFVKHNGDDLDLRYESNNYNDWGATPVDDGGVSWNALFEVRENSVIASTVNNCTSNVINFGNGWYRVVVYVTTSSSITPTSPSNLIRVIGSDTKQFLMYGAMFEQGSYSTSYIPTQGSVVTRLAETNIQTPPSGVIGQTEGTLFAQVGEFPEEHNGRIFAIGDGTADDYITIIKNGSNNNFAVYVDTGGVGQVSYQGSGTLSNNSKIAVGYKNNDYAIYVNGTQVHTDTNASVPSLVKIFIGSKENESSTFILGGSITETKLYNTILSNSELQALTQV